MDTLRVKSIVILSYIIFSLRSVVLQNNMILPYHVKASRGALFKCFSWKVFSFFFLNRTTLFLINFNADIFVFVIRLDVLEFFNTICFPKIFSLSTTQCFFLICTDIADRPSYHIRPPVQSIHSVLIQVAWT